MHVSNPLYFMIPTYIHTHHNSHKLFYNKKIIIMRISDTYVQLTNAHSLLLESEISR